MRVLAEAGDGPSGLELAKRLAPDVALLAIALPGVDGIEVARRIALEAPTTKVVALSVHTEAEIVSQMLKAGALGYVHKGCSFGEVVLAIRTVAGGHRYVCSTMAFAALREGMPDLPVRRPRERSLITPRERGVLKMLAEGRTPREIGAALGISVKTVSTHRRRLMKKLGTHSAAQLIRWALREGLSSVQG